MNWIAVVAIALIIIKIIQNQQYKNGKWCLKKTGVSESQYDSLYRWGYHGEEAAKFREI